MSEARSRALPRLLAAIGVGGLATAGLAASQVLAGVRAGDRAAPVASAAGHERAAPGSFPEPPERMNACYPAGGKTAPRPCLARLDPLLPRLIGQCDRAATHIDEGPVEAQNEGSPAVLCCYRATLPTCSGRPLRVAGAERRARRLRRGDWG